MAFVLSPLLHALRESGTQRESLVCSANQSAGGGGGGGGGSGGGKKKKRKQPLIVNRESRFKYEFLAKYECGIELEGTEVKSVRDGKMNLRDSYCRIKDNELWMVNVNISSYDHASPYFNHEAVRDRKLLLHKKDIRKLRQKTQEQGLTLIATRAYFTERGWLKIEVALARGKKEHDKRETIKKRDDERNLRRTLKSILGLVNAFVELERKEELRRASCSIIVIFYTSSPGG